MNLPRRFGRYELLDHLATGGMAEVFRARSFGVEGFERQVCIKRILPGLSRDPRFVSMFVKEARICAGLTHPNVVQIFELGKVGEDHFMAMEFVHGRDLGRVLRAMRRSRTPMPVGVAVHIVVQALRGLACAHALTDHDGRPMHVVHQDISPHNVLVGFEGETKVFDFGVACIGGQDAAGGRGPGGKVAYMAPEQSAGQAVDARADLYAMGLVLFELLAGRRPSGPGEPGGAGPDVRHQRPEVPEGIARVAARMMASAPGDRPATAHDAADELQAAMYEAGVRAHSGDLRRFLARLFPDSAEQSRPGVVDLSGLASDVAGLGDERRSKTPRTGSRPHTPPGHRAGRRPVVVLMAEVVGMTDASAMLESEHIFRRNLRFLRRARRAVEVHEGMVESWQDDTLTVFFGLPAARDHDVERALACAEALVELARKLPDAAGRVELCVGVHRGEVSVGRPNGRRLRYVSHGDTVKLARHLTLVADPGEVLVSPSLARLARSRYHFTDGPRLGRRSTTRGSVAQRLAHRRTRVESAGGGWVPRSDELHVISKALSALAAGQGSRLVTLGAAGSGKSRLLREVVGLARKRGVRMFGARGLPYGAGGSARVLHDLLHSVLGREGADAVDDPLGARLARLGLPGEEAATLRKLLTGGGRGGRPLKAARSSRGVVEAVASLMRVVSRDQPVIVAIEDTQYLDEPERRLLASLLEEVAELPVLWWLSARETQVAGLPEADHLIRLDRLPSEAVRSLSCHLLGVARIGPALWRVVSRNAEGNPLYVESILGTLQQSGRIRLDVDQGEALLVGGGADVRLPPGLDAMLAERIDALEPALRGVLQLAVTIGPRFTTRLLAEAAGLDDPVPLVEGLVAQRLVVWVGDPSEGRCAIASTLIGQIVLRSLLGAHRRSCHRAVAAAIARLHADDLTPHRVALATHCAGSGDFLDAARHGARAGRWFVSQQLLDRGGKIYQDALQHVEQARTNGDDATTCAHAEAVLRADLGACLARSGRLDAAERHLQVSLDLSAELMLPEMEAASHLQLGKLLRSRGDSGLAAAHLEAARDAAVSGRQNTGWRTQVAVDALEALSMVHHEAGRAADAEACLQEARELAGGDPALLGSVFLAQARPSIRRGEAARARPLLEEALACARAAGDRILEGKAHNNIGILHHVAGDYDAAHACFEAARGIREGLGYRKGVAINLHNIGDTWLRRDETGRAWAAFTESRAIAERLQWRRGVVMNDLFLSHLELRRSGWRGPQVDSLVARLGGHIRAAEALGDRESAVTGRLLLARAYRETQRLEAASEVLDDAMRAAERLDARVLARDLRLEQAKVATARLDVLPHHVTGASLDLAR